jgi:hypothetical protein
VVEIKSKRGSTGVLLANRMCVMSVDVMAFIASKDTGLRFDPTYMALDPTYMLGVLTDLGEATV